jgi:sporulation protein YlmC with PRC-barrel domain
MPRSEPPAAAVKAPAPNPLKQEDVSKIEGASVLGNDGKKLGAVSKVLMKPDEKTIDRLVVHTGGVLGIGGRYLAMSIDDFLWDAHEAAFKISKTADDLTSMAEWTPPGSAPATGSSTPVERTVPASPSGR